MLNDVSMSSAILTFPGPGRLACLQWIQPQFGTVAALPWGKGKLSPYPGYCKSCNGSTLICATSNSDTDLISLGLLQAAREWDLDLTQVHAPGHISHSPPTSPQFCQLAWSQGPQCRREAGTYMCYGTFVTPLGWYNWVVLTLQQAPWMLTLAFCMKWIWHPWIKNIMSIESLNF